MSDLSIFHKLKFDNLQNHERTKVVIKYVVDHILSVNIEIKQVLVFILSPKAVILCVEPYLELKDSTFFFMGGAALYPQTSGSTQTPLGDRGTPLIVTGSTYGESTKMWEKFGFFGTNV